LNDVNIKGATLIWEIRDKYHLHIYTRDEMKSFLAESGFSKVNFLGDFMLVARKT